MRNLKRQAAPGTSGSIWDVGTQRSDERIAVICCRSSRLKNTAENQDSPASNGHNNGTHSCSPLAHFRSASVLPDLSFRSLYRNTTQTEATGRPRRLINRTDRTKFLGHTPIRIHLCPPCSMPGPAPYSPASPCWLPRPRRRTCPYHGCSRIRGTIPITPCSTLRATHSRPSRYVSVYPAWCWFNHGT